MIERNLSRTLQNAAEVYPIVTVTGPRQSGKTTLCRALFADKTYVSLELLDVRDDARRDPRAFLAEHARGAIFDEIQHAPELLSYLQVEVDERPAVGRFVLTGSQHFALSAQIATSSTPSPRCGACCGRRERPARWTRASSMGASSASRAARG